MTIWPELMADYIKGSPHQSKSVAAFSLFAFLAALLISLFQFPMSRNRWLPALLAFGLYLVHGLFPCA